MSTRPMKATRRSARGRDAGPNRGRFGPRFEGACLVGILSVLIGCSGEEATNLRETGQDVRLSIGESGVHTIPDLSLLQTTPTATPLGIADFVIDPVTNMPALDPTTGRGIPAATGQYSVTFLFNGAGTNVDVYVDDETMTGSPADSFTVPARSGGTGTTLVTRVLELRQSESSRTATGTLTFVIDNDPTAVLISAVLAPLRKTSVVDPEASGFSPSDGGSLGSSNCRSCHGSQWNEWRSSMMSYSSISPPNHALELTENHVDPSTREDLRDDTTPPPPPHGRFGRAPFAPNNFTSEEHPQSASSLFCQRCHAPAATYTDVLRVFDLDYSDEDNFGRGKIPDNHSLLKFLVQSDLAAISGLPDTDPAVLDTVGPYEPLLRDLFPGTSPSAQASGRFYQEMDASELSQLQTMARAGTEGVTCTVCHSVNGLDGDPTPARIDPTAEEGIGNSGFRVAHLDGSDVSRINFGPYEDEEFASRQHDLGRTLGPLRPGTDGLTRPFIQTGEMCGTCHDVRIGGDDYGPNGVRDGLPPVGDDSEFRRVENLFTEWRDSSWNNNNTDASENSTTFENPRGFAGTLSNLKTSTTCQDCHMSKYMTHDGAGPGEFDTQTLGGNVVRKSNHRFIGVDRFLIHDVPVFGDGPSDIHELEAYDISWGREPVYPGTTTRVVDEFGNDVVFSDFEDTPENETRDLREILLQKAAELRIENVGQVSGDMLPVSVSVENVGVGHNLPAGLSQERQVWIELEVLDANGSHVYTSGYLNPVPGIDDPEAVEFDPDGVLRYRDSFCATHEYECELDFFRLGDEVEVGPDLSLVREPGSSIPDEDVRFVPGLDPQLANYQNGFTLGAFDPSDELKNKVLTQFIGSHIVNTNSIAPFEKRSEQYMIPVAKVPSDIRSGPYTIHARLRFRPLPVEFLEGLRNAFGGDPDDADPSDFPFPSRITNEAIEHNKVIEMESDACVFGGFSTSDLRACGRVDGSLTSVAAGQGHTCVSWGDELAVAAGTSDGIENRDDYARYTQCFGDNQFGQVGAGVRLGGGADERTAVTVDLINQSTLAAGNAHTCALHRGGTVSCWGSGESGRLGDEDGSAHTSTAPREIAPSVLNSVSTIASADDSTCAVTKGQVPEDDSVYCWGLGDPGELGTGITPAAGQVRTVPSEIAGLEGGESLRGIEQLAAGAHHYCAIADGRKLGGDDGITPVDDALGNPAYTSGHVYCWGSGPGTGQSTPVSRPTPVALPYQATKVVAGEDFSCALTTRDAVYCWGSNEDGRLGVGDAGLPLSLEPIRVARAEERTYDLVAGRAHACLADGFPGSPTSFGVYCWGDGENGKLGDEASIDRDAPTLVHYGAVGLGFTGIVAMAAGAEHTCVVSDGSSTGFAQPGLHCWGDNSSGQLGIDGIASSVDKPTKLEFYDKNDPTDPSDDVAGDLPDPMLEGRSYYATESRGGPGVDGCIVANPPFQQCIDEADLVDVNAGDHFVYSVDAFGGMTELHFEVSMLNGTRSMEVFLNGSATGTVLTANAGIAPRSGTAPDRFGFELPPVTLDLLPGVNEILLADNQGTSEFDMHRVRLVRTQDGTCFDEETNNGETDEDCGGPFCSGCDVGETCALDSDCGSFECESAVCQEPDEPVDPPCDLASAIDMGVHGASTITTSNACLKLTQYPTWWSPRPLKIRRDGGTVSIPFTWDNRGTGCAANAFGSGEFSSGVDEVIVGDGVDELTSTVLNESPVSQVCPTLIKLNGDGASVQIRWWAN